jgi:hypothetical protein
MPSKLHLAGLTKGSLTALYSVTTRRRNGRSFISWICECKCGNRMKMQPCAFRRGDTKHCLECSIKLRSKIDRDGVVSMFEAGNTLEEIAAKYEVEPGHIRVVLRQMNLIEKQKTGLPECTATKEQLAYAAGILDGEGCIHISSRKTKGDMPCICLGVAISNTDRRVIDWLLDTFKAGAVFTRPAKERRKESYSWSLQSEQAEDFLTLVRPYLIIKGEQADVGFELRELTMPKGEPKAKSRLTEQDISERLALKEKLEALRK